MKMKWLLSLTCALLILLIFGQFTASANSRQAINIDVDLAAVDQYLNAQMRRHNLKGMAVAITQGDEVIYLQGFGSAGRGQPVSPQTPFLIGSVSKSFTALAVMQLVDQGLLDLDAPVQQYVPWFTTADRERSSQITIRHFLNQTSGLSDASFRRPFVTEETTLEETVRHLEGAELTATPGTSFQYFNPNYNVLAQVIEAVSGKSYAAYMVENVFTPLEMKHSFVELASAQQAGMAQGHSAFFGLAIPRRQPFYLAELAAGFLISSAEDMAHYTIAQNMAGTFNQTEVLSPQAVTIMHTSPQDVPGDYAMGWSTHDRNGQRIIRHNGAVETFFADMVLLPDREIGVTLLINQNALIPLLLVYEPLSDGLVDVILGQAPSSGMSMRLIYGLLSALVVLDIVRHGIDLSNIAKWTEKVKDKTKSRVILRISLQLLLLPAMLIFVTLMMILTAGINAARITLFYFLPDIALWLLISASLSIVEAIKKLRWLANKPVTG